MGKTHRTFQPYLDTTRAAYVHDRITHDHLQEREHLNPVLKWCARKPHFTLSRTREEVERANSRWHADHYDRAHRDGFTSYLTWTQQVADTTPKARRADDKRRLSKIRLDPDLYDSDAWGGFRNGKRIFWDYW